MVRIAVRTITFNILKYHEQPNMNVYIRQKFALPFFTYLIKCIISNVNTIYESLSKIDQYIHNSCNCHIPLEIRKSFTIDRGISLKNESNLLMEKVDNFWYRISEDIDYISDLFSVLSPDLSEVLKSMFIEELIINTCFKNINVHMVYMFAPWYFYELMNDKSLKEKIFSFLLFEQYKVNDN